MFISKKAIPRRTVLRGLGASLALPLLDGMVPAYAALRTTAAKPVRRLGVCYVPNGMEMRAWTPKGDSRQLELSPILQPLEPGFDHFERPPEYFVIVGRPQRTVVHSFLHDEYPWLAQSTKDAT